MSNQAREAEQQQADDHPDMETVAVWEVEATVQLQRFGDIKRRTVYVVTDSDESPPDLAAVRESFGLDARVSLRRMELMDRVTLNSAEINHWPEEITKLNLSRVEMVPKMLDLAVSAGVDSYFARLVHRDRMNETIAGYQAEVRRLEAIIRASERSEPVPVPAGDDPAPATKAPGPKRSPGRGRTRVEAKEGVEPTPRAKGGRR